MRTFLLYTLLALSLPVSLIVVVLLAGVCSAQAFFEWLVD